MFLATRQKNHLLLNQSQTILKRKDILGSANEINCDGYGVNVVGQHVKESLEIYNQKKIKT